MSKIISESSEWTFEKIEEYYQAIEDIGVNKFGVDIYPNQIEIIGSEQMMDAYASVGMPVMYNHWSYGQEFINTKNQYDRGMMGLAYEIVINSSPCISYLMEENTMTMQALVMAHACIGHNGFFKGNYLFRQWTDAESIIDYLVFAKKYIADCEERYGPDAVEETLDAAHALQVYGVDKYTRPNRMSMREHEEREKERMKFREKYLHEVWTTVPITKTDENEKEAVFPEEPQENIMYFLEKNAPKLDQWQREVIRIVRKISQYFYPQRQTQLMNEGFATFYHYEIVQELYNRGQVNDGFMIEFLKSHTAVVAQPAFDSPYYSGINPYALGFAMYQDIKRICLDPTDEDREWFRDQDWVGNGKPHETVQWAMQNFKDESFVEQLLSPKVIRDFNLFSVYDDDRDPKMVVDAIHNKQGYKLIRENLSRQYNIGYRIPDVQVVKVDRWGDRCLYLQHNVVNRQPLDPENTIEVLKHLRHLWKYDVQLNSVDSDGNTHMIIRVLEEDTTIDVFQNDN